MLNTDIFLKIGDQHKICEDYIVQGDVPVPFIILSDGCSTSENTEMGARILCHLAKQFLMYRGIDFNAISYHKMGNWIIHNAELVARQLGLKISCLTATLIISYVLDDVVYVYMYGDGAVAVQRNNDEINIHSVSFTNNAPYYLSYLIDEYRDQTYYEAKNSKILCRTYGDGSKISDEIAYDAKVVHQYGLNRCKNIFICSDGIESFIKKDPRNREILNPQEILPDLMAFKNLKGEFLKRRMKRALTELENQGIGHFDDLSIGAYTRLK